jgi:hypothetical protein
MAHHCGIVRKEDQHRFRYYNLKPDELINPPKDLAIELILFLHDLGSNYLNNVEEGIFKKIIPILSIDPENPQPIIKRLIEVFDFFGKVSIINHVPLDLSERKVLKEKVKNQLLKECVNEIIEKYG